MLVKDLISLLEEFDQDDVFAVEVCFPEFCWHVTDFPTTVTLSEEEQPAFRVEVFGTDFEYPDVLERMKAWVDSIYVWPELPGRTEEP